MCSVEGALPYVVLAILCPAAYEGILRQKMADLLGASSAVARPHDDAQDSDRDGSDSQQ